MLLNYLINYFNLYSKINLPLPDLPPNKNPKIKPPSAPKPRPSPNLPQT